MIALVLAFWLVVSVPVSIAVSIVYFPEAPWLWAVLLLLCIAVSSILFCLFVVLSEMEKRHASLDPYNRFRTPVQ